MNYQEKQAVYTFTLPVKMERLFAGVYNYGRNDSLAYFEQHINLTPCVDMFNKTSVRIYQWNSGGYPFSGYGFCFLLGCAF